MTSEIDVTDRGDRFQIAVDGQAAGFTMYRDREGVRIFPHTEVDPEFQGRGLSGPLIRAALDTTRAAGLQVAPLCPAVSGFIVKHPEYADLVTAEHRARLGLE